MYSTTIKLKTYVKNILKRWKARQKLGEYICNILITHINNKN